jgi:hypothetical protein
MTNMRHFMTLVEGSLGKMKQFGLKRIPAYIEHDFEG